MCSFRILKGAERKQRLTPTATAAAGLVKLKKLEAFVISIKERQPLVVIEELLKSHYQRFDDVSSMMQPLDQLIDATKVIRKVISIEEEEKEDLLLSSSSHHADYYLSVLQLILRLQPALVMYCMPLSQELPLHRAAAISSVVSIVEYLYRQYPISISMKDKEGRLPLHRAVGRSLESSSPIISKLIEWYPFALRVPDERGWLPLHYAACNSSMDTIKLLVKPYPEAILAKASDGKTASFYASRFNANHKSVGGSLLLLDKALRSTRKEIKTAHVHICCGDPLAGKSIISHWIHDILRERMLSKAATLFTDPTHEISVELGRTRGIETKKTIEYDKGSKMMILHDYGGQGEFQINHAVGTFIKVPMTV